MANGIMVKQVMALEEKGRWEDFQEREERGGSGKSGKSGKSAQRGRASPNPISPRSISGLGKLGRSRGSGERRAGRLGRAVIDYPIRVTVSTHP